MMRRYNNYRRGVVEIEYLERGQVEECFAEGRSVPKLLSPTDAALREPRPSHSLAAE